MSSKPAEQLFQAIRKNDIERVKALITADNNLLTARNERGTPPLTLATYLGNLEVGKWLIEAGADLEAKDAAGTALMGVSFKGNTEIVKYLIDAGADVNATNEQGTSALIFAAMFNQGEVIDLLLENGADNQLKDGQGLTAADHVRNRGLTELAEKLS